jgi:intergrase/recombinase
LEISFKRSLRFNCLEGVGAWFSIEMNELGVPDRFVDIFQIRDPRTILAKHYVGKGLQQLKRIYEKANLKVLK